MYMYKFLHKLWSIYLTSKESKACNFDGALTATVALVIGSGNFSAIYVCERILKSFYFYICAEMTIAWENKYIEEVLKMMRR